MLPLWQILKVTKLIMNVLLSTALQGIMLPSVRATLSQVMPAGYAF
jgi:hypothetical protein